MSRIEDTKTRLGGMFLRDRTGIDERTAAMIEDELRRVLGEFLSLSRFDFKISPSDGAEAEISLIAKGKRFAG